jgi:hypothetical protein
MEEVKLAEVISRVVQAVLGDLIPVTQSYSMGNFISGGSQKAAAQWLQAAGVGKTFDRLHGQVQSMAGRGAP